jgi:hypothetical protein
MLVAMGWAGLRQDFLRLALDPKTNYIHSSMAKSKQKAATSDLLKGWAAIAKFLGLTPATAQRWAKAGMPVRREGRFTVADRAELEAWLRRESGMSKPAHVMTGDADISAALKDSIAEARRIRKS